jgi:hypothetical protein
VVVVQCIEQLRTSRDRTEVQVGMCNESGLSDTLFTDVEGVA